MRAFAALDLGTTRTKLAGFIPGVAPFAVIAEARNEVEHGPGGAARCRWSALARAVDGLMAALGAWCRARGVARVDLGLCGHVSSLIAWDRAADAPRRDDFPIWMDATCAPA